MHLRSLEECRSPYSFSSVANFDSSSSWRVWRDALPVAERVAERSEYLPDATRKPLADPLDLTSFDELVAGAVHRHDEARFLGMWFQLLPEVNDVRVDGSRVRVVLITPDRIEQAIAAECLSGMGDEVRQQRELLRRELNDGTGASASLPRVLTSTSPKRKTSGIGTCGGTCRSTALMRAISSRIENGLVT